MPRQHRRRETDDPGPARRRGKAKGETPARKVARAVAGGSGGGGDRFRPESGSVVEGRTFSGGSGGLDNPFLDLSGVEDVEFRNCIFEDSRRSILKGDPGRNVRFVDCIARNMQPDKGIHGAILIYPGSHKATSRIKSGMVHEGWRFENIEAGDIFEVKVSDVTITRCHKEGGSEKAGIRVRHGTGCIITDNTGDWGEFTFRCGPHEVHNNQARCVALAGNLPGQKGKWEHLHKPGSGTNMQAAFRVNFSGNKETVIGKVKGDHRSHPALECNVDPDDGNVRMEVERETKREKRGRCSAEELRSAA